MKVPAELTWSLEIGSGICWTLVYLIIIHLGFREKTYGMPIPALCANVSWEFLFSFIHPHEPPQNYINLTWFAFDLVIVFQTLCFGTTALPSKKLFYAAFVLGLVVSFGAITTITYEFSDWDGKYSAFGQNLMMSILFIAMLLRRQDLKGQSIFVAIFKMVGTLLPSLLFFLRFPGSVLLNFLYISIFVFDLIYFFMLYLRHKQLGINPWLKF